MLGKYQQTKRHLMIFSRVRCLTSHFFSFCVMDIDVWLANSKHQQIVDKRVFRINICVRTFPVLLSSSLASWMFQALTINYINMFFAPFSPSDVRFVFVLVFMRIIIILRYCTNLCLTLWNILKNEMWFSLMWH